MTEYKEIPESAVDPVCGKTIDPHKVRFNSKDDRGVVYFCSDKCRREYDAADTESKKGFWARYTDRLKETHCTRNTQECR